MVGPTAGRGLAVRIKRLSHRIHILQRGISGGRDLRPAVTATLDSLSPGRLGRIQPGPTGAQRTGGLVFKDGCAAAPDWRKDPPTFGWAIMSIGLLASPSKPSGCPITVGGRCGPLGFRLRRRPAIAARHWGTDAGRGFSGAEDRAGPETPRPPRAYWKSRP